MCAGERTGVRPSSSDDCIRFRCGPPKKIHFEAYQGRNSLQIIDFDLDWQIGASPVILKTKRSGLREFAGGNKRGSPYSSAGHRTRDGKIRAPRVISSMNLCLRERPSMGRIARVGIIVAWMAAVGCSGGQTVTAENLDAARGLWAKAGIRDYDLEYTTAPANGHFLVTVRGGEVKKVEGIGSMAEPGTSFIRRASVLQRGRDLHHDRRRAGQAQGGQAIRSAQGHHDRDEVQDPPRARLSRVVSPRHHGHISEREDRGQKAHANERRTRAGERLTKPIRSNRRSNIAF